MLRPLSLCHLSCLSASPQSTPGGPTASRGSCGLHPRWTGEKSTPVCDRRTAPQSRSSARSCEPRSTPSSPLTDTRATAHVRAAHACALVLRVRFLGSLASPIARELKTSGRAREDERSHKIVKYNSKCVIQAYSKKCSN